MKGDTLSLWLYGVKRMSGRRVLFNREISTKLRGLEVVKQGEHFTIREGLGRNIKSGNITSA